MAEIQAVDRAIQAQLQERLQELSRLCAQPSVSAENIGIQECAEMVAEMLRGRGFSVRSITTDGNPVVYAVRPGRTDRTLLFYLHYDVQPPEPLELWSSPPFEPIIREGKMFARGVSDDKGHILCRLAAIDAILAVEGELPCEVKFLIEGEEETGSMNLPAFIASHIDLLASDACLWEFGGVNHEGVPVGHAGVRGILYVELSVNSADQDAHSGLGGSIFPNAAWRLTWALNSLKGPDERIRIPGFYDRVMPPTERDLQLLSLLPDEAADLLERYGLRGFLKGLTGGVELLREAVFTPSCTICGLVSGYQGPGSKTVLPARASAKVDFRLVPNQDPGEVFTQLRNHLDREGFSDVEITDLGGEVPARTDPDDPFIRLVAESAREVYGREQLIAPISGGTGPEHAFIQHLGVPIATAGISYPGANTHAPDENIVLDNFVNGARHTARILMAFGSLE